MIEYNFESDLELASEKATEIENEKKEVKDSIEKLNAASSLVLKDQAMQKILQNLKNNQESKLELITEEKKGLLEKLHNWAECVREANEQNQESYQIVQELKSIDLSLDEANRHCEERQQIIDENISMITGILKVLGEDFEGSGFETKIFKKNKVYTPMTRKSR